MHFDTIDIDFVFVEATTSHVVLATEFVVLIDTGKSDEDAFNRAAGSIRHESSRSGVNLIHRAGSVFHASNFDFFNPLLVRRERDVDIEHVLISDNTLLGSDIAYH